MKTIFSKIFYYGFPMFSFYYMMSGRCLQSRSESFGNDCFLQILTNILLLTNIFRSDGTFPKKTSQRRLSNYEALALSFHKRWQGRYPRPMVERAASERFLSAMRRMARPRLILQAGKRMSLSESLSFFYCRIVMRPLHKKNLYFFTSQRPPLSGPTLRITLSVLSLFKFHSMPRRVNPVLSISSF